MRADGLTVIVGAGPAGCAAAVQCSRLGVPVRLFDRTGCAGGLIVNGFSIENYPGLERPLSGPAFARRLSEHLARFGVAVERGELTGLEPQGDGWLCRFDGSDLPCHSLILCTGTRPRPFHVDGDAGLRTRVFHEVRKLLDALDSPGEVVVVGGGEAAFDYALTLAARGVRVTVAVRGESPRARGRLAGMVTSHRAIRVAPATRVVALAGAGERVALRAVSPTGEETWECDAVLAAVGRQSDVAGLVGAHVDGASLDRLEPRPGLFLCGDARSGSLGQAAIAVGDGLRAAKSAAERREGSNR